MTKAERKRRAAVGAVSLLRWRDKDADREMARARFNLTLVEMRREAEDAAQRRRWRSRSIVVCEDLPRANTASHYS